MAGLLVCWSPFLHMLWSMLIFQSIFLICFLVLGFNVSEGLSFLNLLTGLAVIVLVLVSSSAPRQTGIKSILACCMTIQKLTILEFFDAAVNRLHRMSLNLYHLLALEAAPALTCSQDLGQLLHSLLLSLLRGAMDLLDDVGIVVVEHVRWCWNGMLAAATVGGALPR